MKETKEDASPYSNNGYRDREDYLDNLADEHGVEPFVIAMMADMLGESEDFDGLVSELENMEDSGLLDEFRSNGGGDEKVCR
jgi:hypothetical protein